MATFANTPDKITYFAETDYRSKRIKFGIRDQDRERHMYVIGKTGMGKSTLLENLAIQDIANGEGLCFIDPHGGTAETLLAYVPEHRIKDVIYFAPFDQEFPVALNVMEDIGRDKRSLVASGLIGAFKKVWVDAWSARMEYILSNALLALLEYPGATLLGVNRIFADKNYRSLIVNNVADPSVKAFWVDEYAKYSDKFATEATAAIQNKVGQFAANPLIRNMVGQSKSTFDIREVMDERKILIVNLSKGRMGESNANLIGSMLITKIYLAAMSRADVGAEVVKGLPPFYLYVDEFQSFANESFADILSEARKYKLSLTVAHQYIEQMSDEVRAAVFGNVGTMCSFRVGAYDAEVLEKEFAPSFTAEDMVNLGFAQIYLRLMINGVGSPPFSATTLNSPKFPPHTYTDQVIAMSRSQFGRPRTEIEEEIRKWHEPVPEPPRDPNAPPIPETRKYAPGTRPVRAFPTGASAAYAGLARSAAAEGIPRYAAGEALPQGAGLRASIIQATNKNEYPPQTPPSAAIPREISAAPLGTMRNVPETDQLLSLPPEEENRLFHQPFRNEFVKAVETVHAVDAGIQIEPEAPPARIPQQEPVLMPPAVSLQSEPNKRPAVSSVELSPAASHHPVMPPRPAGLSSLKSQPKKNKGPSTENLSSLKTLIDTAFARHENKGKSEAANTPQQKTSQQLPPKEHNRQQQQKPFHQMPPSAPPPRVPQSLLDDASHAPALKEIPENVLRGVLAD